METARMIMAVLTAAGYEAYIVGGAVRDILRGTQPVDIDITTNAMPDQIVEIAEKHGWKAITVGAAFGVVAVVVAGRSYEIATFRSERYGIDSHRPETVELGVSLEQDLARRDFTINAMALAADGRIIDLFGGREDLADGIIRVVGSPEERFAEDGLRMFRAARFAARFNFVLEPTTFTAITSNLDRISGLSVERVRNEIEKTLEADFAARGLDILLKSGLMAANCQAREQRQLYVVPILPELCHLDGLPQNPRYHLHDVWQHTLEVVSLVPRDLTLRWAALLHDMAKGCPGVRTINKEGQPSDPGHDKTGAEVASAILHRLRVARQMADRVAWLIRHHLVFPAAETKAVLKWLKRLAADFKSESQFQTALLQLFALHAADRLGGHTQPDIDGLYNVKKLAQTLLSEVPLFSTQLMLSARDIAAKLGSGPEVSRFQQNLLTRIQAGQLVNEPAVLVAALDARARRLAQKQEEHL